MELAYSVYDQEPVLTKSMLIQVTNQTQVRIWKILVSFLIALIPVTTRGQAYEAVSFPEIELTLPENQYQIMQRLKGRKLEFAEAKLSINGQEGFIEDLHLRGKSTLQFTRKSFSVELKEGIPLQVGNETMLLKDFNLLNLVMDKNLWHNRWAFSMLSRLGIFPLAYTYCTVKINKQPYGIYLLVEKPKRAMVALGSPYMVRRGPDHIIEKDYDRGLSREELKGFRKQFRDLYKVNGLSRGELLSHLQASLNMDRYFTWLGFNYLVMNGDYSDELFLYINPDSERFELLAWDYDDLFKEAPHEGRAQRNAALQKRLIFSLEDPLDRLIASDEVVYSSYLLSLEKMMLQIDSALVSETSHQVLKELQQLSTDPQNREMSRYLDREPFNMEAASLEIDQSMRFVLARRAFILNEIKEKTYRE